MLKRKLTARPIQYYGNALSKMLRAEQSLVNAQKSLERAYDFLEDQEQLMTRFKEDAIDAKDAKDAKEEVKRVIKLLENVYDEVDDCAVGIEIRQHDYLNIK